VTRTRKTATPLKTGPRRPKSASLTREADAVSKRLSKVIDFFAPDPAGASVRMEIARQTILEGGGNREDRLERAVQAALSPEKYWQGHPADLSSMTLNSRVTSQGNLRISGELHPGVFVAFTVRDNTLRVSFIADAERSVLVGFPVLPERELASEEASALRKFLVPYAADPAARRILELLGERRKSWPSSGLFL
jgi:hypothetical protein